VSAEGLVNGIAVLIYIACIVGSLLIAFYRSLIAGLLAVVGSVFVCMCLLAWGSTL
jgi:hypothetical protein